MFFSLLTFLVLLSTSETVTFSSMLAQGGVNNICDLKCGEEPHILCKPPKKPNKEKCGKDFYEYPIDAEFIEVMADGHNGIRNRIAGSMKVANMRLVLWSDELAKMSKYWLRQCEPYKIDPCADLEQVLDDASKYHTLVRQNKVTHFSKYYPGHFRTVSLRTWYMEKNNMSRPKIVSGDGKEKRGYFNIANNFTNIAHAGATFVGCAMSRNKKLYEILCNYAAIRVNSSTFTVGKPTTICPNRFPIPSLKFENLCEGRGSLMTAWNISFSMLLNFLISSYLKLFENFY